MKSRSRDQVLALLIAALAISGCRETKVETALEVQWVRSSIEYQLLCHQVYRDAWEYVKSRTRSLREDWAVILDIDMTVLDNSEYQEGLRRENRRFPDGWEEYVRKAETPPVPGAVAFVDSVRSLGGYAHIVYITDRRMAFHEPTRENLMKMGLWEEGDVLLCRQSGADRPDTKADRREEVAMGSGRCEGMGERTIVALVGDLLSDVTEIPSGLPLDDLKRLYSRPENLPENCFILPNPMYGNWIDGYR